MQIFSRGALLHLSPPDIFHRLSCKGNETAAHSKEQHIREQEISKSIAESDIEYTIRMFNASVKESLENESRYLVIKNYRK